MQQRLWNEARETAEVLIEERGFDGAMDYVKAAHNASTTPFSFWLQVWRELKHHKPA